MAIAVDRFRLILLVNETVTAVRQRVTRGSARSQRPQANLYQKIGVRNRVGTACQMRAATAR